MRNLKMKRLIFTMLMFPVDLIRLTFDAWRYTLEWPDYNTDQRCIYCCGCENSEAPRTVFNQIRYWNLWMPRLLHPELQKVTSKTKLRPVPVCHREGGYHHRRRHIPLLAMVLAGIWTTLLVWAIVEIGLVPPEVVGRF